MFNENNSYDRGVNTFSPEGRLFQVEYAIQAIKLGSTCVGIQTNQGIVLGAEKRLNSKLMEPTSVKKIVEITDSHIAALSGLIQDGRILLEHGRVEAQNYKFTYDEQMKTESLVRRMGDFCMDFGENAPMSRPLGVAFLVAGMDTVNGIREPKLFCLDPSGTFFEYRAKAIGAGAESAQQTLQENYNSSMELTEAINLILDILKAVMEASLEERNVDLWTLTPENGIHKIENEELTELLASMGDNTMAT